MDISVSHLNKRMALRVPAELPLGLVFIVGTISDLRSYSSAEMALQLVEGEHTLPCRLPRHVAEETQLVGNERVRASGHLVFDPREARYILLAQDVEVIVRQPERETEEARRVLAELEKQAETSKLAKESLPEWVKQLAPREIQIELGLLEEDERTRMPAEQTGDREHLPPLPPDMISFLSDAIDSEGDVELTSEVVHGLMPADAEHEDVERSSERPDEAVPPEPVTLPEPPGVTASHQRPDLSPPPDAEPPASPSVGSGLKPQQRNAFLFLIGLAAFLVFLLLLFLILNLVSNLP